MPTELGLGFVQLGRLLELLMSEGQLCQHLYDGHYVWGCWLPSVAQSLPGTQPGRDPTLHLLVAFY